MARRMTGTPLAGLVILALGAPHAASAQPAENNAFEWRDFDLSGETDPSSPYHATPEIVAEGIDWSAFGRTITPALAFEGEPMNSRGAKAPEPKPSLATVDIDWSLYD